MDKVSEVTQATLERLMSSYYVWVGLLAIVLAFAVYLYLFPKAIEFFKGSEKQEEPKKTAPEAAEAAAKNASQN
jgi:hypothetical protein